MLNSCLLRISFAVQLCASVTDLLKTVPAAGWQKAQESSLAKAPPAWFTPVAQLIASWQEPHAAREGTVFQLATFAALPVWQAWQLASTAGKAAFLQVASLLPTV